MLCIHEHEIIPTGGSRTVALDNAGENLHRIGVHSNGWNKRWGWGEGGVIECTILASYYFFSVFLIFFSILFFWISLNFTINFLLTVIFRCFFTLKHCCLEHLFSFWQGNPWLTLHIARTMSVYSLLFFYFYFFMPPAPGLLRWSPM